MKNGRYCLLPAQLRHLILGRHGNLWSMIVFLECNGDRECQSSQQNSYHLSEFMKADGYSLFSVPIPKSGPVWQP